MATAYLLSNLLSLSSVKLGRLVLSSKRPNDAFIDPLQNRPARTELGISTQNDYSVTGRFSRRSKLQLRLSGILQFSSEDVNSGTATLSAPEATTYDLQNSESWFEDACKEEPTRRFLEKAIDKDRNVYLVVGFRTVRNAKVAGNTTRKKGRGVNGTAPIKVLTGTLGTGLASQIEPSGNNDEISTDTQKLSFNAPGEQVFAVLYRKVKFTWHSSRKVDNMFLEVSNRWISYWGWRGPGEDDDTDEDDVLEASLGYDSDLDTDDDESGKDEPEGDEFGDGEEIDDVLDEISAVPNTAGNMQGDQKIPEVVNESDHYRESTLGVAGTEGLNQSNESPDTSNITKNTGEESPKVNDTEGAADQALKTPAVRFRQKPVGGTPAKVTKLLLVSGFLVIIIVLFFRWLGVWDMFEDFYFKKL